MVAADEYDAHYNDLNYNPDARTISPPAVAPTSTDFATLMAQTFPYHWFPFDDLALASGKGKPRDLGIVGRRDSHYQAGSLAPRVNIDDPANVGYIQPSTSPIPPLLPRGVVKGLSLTPGASSSYEFNPPGLGTGAMQARIGQHIDITNATMGFVVRARDFRARGHHLYSGYQVPTIPYLAVPRIIGDYDSPGFAVLVELGPLGNLMVQWGIDSDTGASSINITTDRRLGLDRVHQVFIVASQNPQVVTVWVDGEVWAQQAYDVYNIGRGLASGNLRVGGEWQGENNLEWGLQGEVAHAALWNYPLPAAYIKQLRRAALMLTPPRSNRRAVTLARDLSKQIPTAVRTAGAVALTKTNGPDLPNPRFGLGATERQRLLTTSLQGAKLALVTSVGGDAAAGAEVSGGGYVRQAVDFTISATEAVSTKVLRFTDVPPGSLMGWELWSGTERRWYGYWSLAAAGWVDGLLTSPNHGLVAGDRVVFPTGAAPAGITANATYYVRDVAVSTFRVSTSVGGAAVGIAGGGTTRFGRALEVPASDSVEIEAGHLKLKLE